LKFNKINSFDNKIKAIFFIIIIKITFNVIINLLGFKKEIAYD